MKSLQKLDAFVLKIIAMVTMTFDHIGIFIQQTQPENPLGMVFRVIGRIAFPLYAFFLAEGMRHTHSKEKYLLRIGIMWALISVAESIFVYGIRYGGYTPDTLAPEPFTDLFFCLLFLYFLTRPKGWKAFSILPAAIMGLSFVVDVHERMNGVIIHWFPYYLRFGYGLYGLVMVLFFYFAPSIVKKLYAKRIAQEGMPMEEFEQSVEFRRQANLISIGGLIISVIVFWAIGYIGRGIDYAPFDVYYMGIGSYALLAGFLLYFYSGKLGYNSKAFRIIYYLYFPLHLVILFLIFSFAI